MKKYFILILVLYIVGCCHTNFDRKNSNQRSYDIIKKEKEYDKSTGVKTFDTDTNVNFMTKEEIIKIYGKPISERTVRYNYPSPNILWILEGPLGKVNDCTVIMMEWEYPKEDLRRVVLFIKDKCEWISICNVLYDSGLNF